MLKRPRYQGKLGSWTEGHIQRLTKKRKERMSSTLLVAKAGGLGGYLGAVFFGGIRSPSFYNNVASCLVGTAVGASMGASIGHGAHRENIRLATANIARSLRREAKTNPPLVQFLRKYEYIFIDRKGRITGSNFSGMRVGRLRISTDKILSPKEPA